MLTLIFSVVAIALAGTASAAGWRSLRVDASSEAAFEQSLAEFKDELPRARRFVFGEALKDIWIAGSQAAASEQREYTAAEYYRQLDGLTYEEVVTLIDPTGDVARARYRQASFAPPPVTFPEERPSRTMPSSNSEFEPRGGTPLFGPSLPR